MKVYMQTYADKLKWITDKTKQDKKWKFRKLAHLINPESLAQCYKKLNKSSACGTDGVQVKEYGNNLKANVSDLYSRIKSMKYKPKAVRRVYIPKNGSKEKRPLGLPSTEDKLVQMALKEILEAIFEQDFLECSHGFRPGKSCHTAIKELNRAVMYRPTNYVVEVDIKKFFDTVDHKWLYEMLKQRILDPVFLGLIWRMLRAGVMENNKETLSEHGTPQGGIISPMLANVYLHYVLDLWFEKRFKPKARGYVQLIRYSDDFVAVCENEQDATDFLEQLKARLAKFKLKIAEEKTQIIEFGRKAWERSRRSGKKVDSFDFLGFTHYCKASTKGWFNVGHKTSKKRLTSKLKAFNSWLKSVRNMYPMREWWKRVKAKLRGHYNYFGINGNTQCINQFYRRVLKICYKWINSRSQKKSIDYEGFAQYLKWNPLPTPRVYHPILYPIGHSK